MTAKKSASCPDTSSEMSRQTCCSTQSISVRSGSEINTAKTSEVSDKQIKEVFDVLFFYTLYKNIFGEETSSNQAESPSPGLIFSEAILLLLKQFRI